MKTNRKEIGRLTDPRHDHHIATPPHRHTITSPHHHTTTPLHHHTTIPPHHYTTTPPHHHTITPPHHPTTTPSHHHTTTPPRRLEHLNPCVEGLHALRHFTLVTLENTFCFFVCNHGQENNKERMNLDEII